MILALLLACPTPPIVEQAPIHAERYAITSNGQPVDRFTDNDVVCYVLGDYRALSCVVSSETRVELPEAAPGVTRPTPWYAILMLAVFGGGFCFLTGYDVGKNRLH